MHRRSLRSGPAPWAAVLLLVSLAGCGLTEEDERVCAGVECSAGFCLAEQGQPVCHCGAWELALGELCVARGGVLEPDDTSEGATPLEPTAAPRDFTFRARAEGERDADHFTFEALSAHTYRFTCTAHDIGCRLSVTLPGELSPLQASGRPGTTLVFEARRSGRHALQAQPDLLRGGAYSLRMEDLGEDDFADSPEQARPRTPSPEPFTVLRQGPLDRDVFAIDALAGHLYRLACTASAPGGWEVLLTDARGQELRRALAFGNLQGQGAATMDLEAPADGRLFAELVVTSGTGPDSYTCRLEDLGLDDHGDTFPTATVLTPGGASARGALEVGGDSDVFTFSGVARHLYRFSLTGENGLSTSCRRFTEDATGLHEARSCGNLLFEVEADATVYVSVRAEGLGRYTYRLEDLGVDDHAGSAPTATPLAVGSPTSVRVVDFGDVDHLTFNASAWHLYRLTVSPPPPLQEYLLFPRTEAGPRVGRPENPSTEARYILEATRDGPVLLQLGGGARQYQLVLEALGPEDHGETAATATPLALGQTGSGHIDVSGDTDAFAVPLEAGRSYSLNFTGATASWSVSVLAPHGARVNTFSSVGTHAFTPTVAGTHTFQVSASLTWDLDYQLSVQ